MMEQPQKTDSTAPSQTTPGDASPRTKLWPLIGLAVLFLALVFFVIKEMKSVQQEAAKQRAQMSQQGNYVDPSSSPFTQEVPIGDMMLTQQEYNALVDSAKARSEATRTEGVPRRVPLPGQKPSGSESTARSATTAKPQVSLENRSAGRFGARQASGSSASYNPAEMFLRALQSDIRSGEPGSGSVGATNPSATNVRAFTDMMLSQTSQDRSRQDRYGQARREQFPLGQNDSRASRNRPARNRPARNRSGGTQAYGAASADPMIPTKLRSDREQGQTLGERAGASHHAVLEAPEPFELKRGTVIACSMIHAVNSNNTGDIQCQVTEDVYDKQGRHLLLPRYSRFHGVSGTGLSYGDNRLLVAWHSVVYPDGTSFSLPELEGVDQLGRTGLRGQLNNHWGQVLASAMMVSLVGAGYQLAAGNNTGGFFQQNNAREAISLSIAQEINRVLNRVVDRQLSVEPTIDLPAGLPTVIYVRSDIVLPQPYSPVTRW